MTPPQNQRRPTVTLNRALGKRRRSSVRTAWTTGIATNPSGSASARQRIRFRRPMPGSIRIDHGPGLDSPNTSETKSMPGRTSSASRVPGVTPSSRSPRAMRSLSWSNSRKVTLPIAPFSTAVVAQRLDHGDGVGHEPGHDRQPAGYIDGVTVVHGGGIRHVCWFVAGVLFSDREEWAKSPRVIRRGLIRATLQDRGWANPLYPPETLGRSSPAVAHPL